jgi:hypothetical protein
MTEMTLNSNNRLIKAIFSSFGGTELRAQSCSQPFLLQLFFE